MSPNKKKEIWVSFFPTVKKKGRALSVQGADDHKTKHVVVVKVAREHGKQCASIAGREVTRPITVTNPSREGVKADVHRLETTDGIGVVLTPKEFHLMLQSCLLQVQHR
jgi:hypothetical protein